MEYGNMDVSDDCDNDGFQFIFNMMVTLIKRNFLGFHLVGIIICGSSSMDEFSGLFTYIKALTLSACMLDFRFEDSLTSQIAILVCNKVAAILLCKSASLKQVCSTLTQTR
ncbi:hypothetical protein AVEN_24009-1 [Araneus ventricosus]|uniref:Uncharacterized protein n=1 Tax=Araneus ventricosus TaxID=182803 RepID=A0A4Y2D1P8_ARAVE|nr:hypothetical protein AVEN_24009-1 [Araneus ventricosus]